VKFGEKPVLIGERINPTGKKRFKEALREGDIGYILGEGITQEEKGADVLDVNVGLPEIDEKAMLTTAVSELQAVTPLPLQIDTADAYAMEAALRIYNGKAMVNSVNGKEESMRAVFPLVKKYGGVVVALTLDENGIPKTAHERVEIAKKIIATAEEYGIEKKDIVFDTLAMAVSADKNAALATLGALRTIKTELGCHTSLGVSNISFGLPARDAVNSAFFAMALENGLSAAIMNPNSVEMMKTYHAFCALHGLDENCADYINFAANMPAAEASAAAPAPKAEGGKGSTELQNAIIKGLREKAAALTKQMLASTAPLDIVQREIIPSLDIIGKGFEEKTVYLPELLISAEAAKSAFAEIKAFVTAKGGASVKKCDFVLATVKGDVHDIGKNIVKLLLENYGFNVIDLGKDVPPEAIAEAAERTGAPFVGLSALMTTTVPAMEETIKLLRARTPAAKIIVGGAVLTAEYAARIGADKYAADAMETVRYADAVFAEINV
jgi:5-methyltetrahydrofolate--homocysteine methyltransferase